MQEEEQEHRDEPSPYKYLIALGDEHSKSLNRLCELEEQKIRKGRSYHITMTLLAGDTTARPVLVDFVRGTNKNGSTNLPSDCNNDFPYSKVFKVTLKAATGGANLNYGLGRSVSEMPGLLLTGTSISFDSIYPIYEQIAIARAAGSGSTVSVVEIILEV